MAWFTTGKVRGNHGSLAFVEMPAGEVFGNDKGFRIVAKVFIKVGFDPEFQAGMVTILAIKNEFSEGGNRFLEAIAGNVGFKGFEV